MTNKSVELKACPFCGGEVRLCWDEKNHGEYFYECIECDTDGCGLVEFRCETFYKEKAIEAWNTRTPEAQWIALEDEMPKKNRLVCFIDWDDVICSNDIFNYVHENQINYAFTHWKYFIPPVCETDKEEDG